MTEKSVKAAAGKKPAAKKKKPAAAKPASSFRLSAAEKKLVQNYRKCNLIEKKVIETIVEKAGDLDLTQLLGSLVK
jgi:hypothetical protein